MGVQAINQKILPSVFGKKYFDILPALPLNKCIIVVDAVDYK
jgi:hypothetical protein